MIDGRSMGDEEILKITKQKNCGGDIRQFFITLPSGREFSSDEFKIEKGIAIAWCNAVRDQISADYRAQEQEALNAKKARKAKEASEASAQEEAPTGIIIPPAAAEPPRSRLEDMSLEDMLEHDIATWRTKICAREEEIEEIEKELVIMRSNHDKCMMALNALTGEE